MIQINTKVKRITVFVIMFFTTFSKPTMAADSIEEKLSSCLFENIHIYEENKTVGELKKHCIESIYEKGERELDSKNEYQLGLISKRFIEEAATEKSHFSITPHLMNYLVPVLTTNRVNTNAYNSTPEFQDNFEDKEAKIQLSLKVPLTQESLFLDEDRIYFGFTLQAWWQVYANNISKPFRETNYKPEVFYTAPLDWHPLGGNSGFGLGIEHQSNGRTQELSRSWNRVYASFLFEKGNLALSMQSWWRIPEKSKRFYGDPEGDDNSDITDYMGYFEIGSTYKWKEYELSVLTRQNFSTHKGALELAFTFPVWGKTLGYASFFTGYGESLIDYNHKQTRFGLGLALNNIF